MASAQVLLALLLTSSALTFSNACVAPDCDRPDLGTCVNACCKLQFDFPNIPPAGLVHKLAALIAAGGPEDRTDGRYYTVESNTVQPWSSADDFVVQAMHESQKQLYNDTMHLAVQPHKMGRGSVLFAFSHSQDFIKNNFAFGDHGQNYKNLVQLVKGLKQAYVEKTLLGCPAASVPVSVQVDGRSMDFVEHSSSETVPLKNQMPAVLPPCHLIARKGPSSQGKDPNAPADHCAQSDDYVHACNLPGTQETHGTCTSAGFPVCCNSDYDGKDYWWLSATNCSDLNKPFPEYHYRPCQHQAVIV